MRFHDLKCVRESFEAIRQGTKRAEFRRDDRGFAVGDVLVLRSGSPADNAQGFVYHESALPELVQITHIARGPDFGIPEGYAMLSFERVELRSGLPF